MSVTTWRERKYITEAITLLKGHGYTVLPKLQDWDKTPKPEGLGYLKKIVDDQAQPHAARFAPIGKFQRMLVMKGIRTHYKPTALDRAKAKEYAEKPPGEIVYEHKTLKLTAVSWEVLQKLAIAANVSVPTVVEIAIYYGLEKMAADLRAQGSVAEPKFQVNRSTGAVKEIPTGGLIGV